MPDLSTLLDSAALPERTVDVCLRGDLVAQVQELERELDANVPKQATMAGRGEARRIAERIQQIRDEMATSTIVFRLRGLNRQGWSELVAAHPPRQGNETDDTLGYNEETFFPALIRACLVEPEVTDEQWHQLLEVLSSAQFNDLNDAALAVTRRKVSVPFSLAASVSLSSFDETSK